MAKCISILFSNLLIWIKINGTYGQNCMYKIAISRGKKSIIQNRIFSELLNLKSLWGIIEVMAIICPILQNYRHWNPNPDSHSTMRVRIEVPMSVVQCVSPREDFFSVGTK